MLRTVNSPSLKMPPALQTAVVGILHQPDLNRSPGHIKSGCVTKDVEQNGLHHLFGFRCIVQNAVGNGKHQLAKTVKEDGQSVMLALNDFGYKLLVRELVQPAAGIVTFEPSQGMLHSSFIEQQFVGIAL